jgi:gp16 family phage-associated protein
MNHKATLSADQVRQKFRERGITFTQWARKHGYDRKAVYRVLSGTDKANFGRAHEIAVALGNISDKDSNPQDAYRH